MTLTSKVETSKSYEELSNLPDFKKKLDELHKSVKAANAAKEAAPDSEVTKEAAKKAYLTFYEIFSPEKQKQGKMSVEVGGVEYVISSDVLKEQVKDILLLQQEVDNLLDAKTKEEILATLENSKEVIALKDDVVSNTAAVNTATVNTATVNTAKVGATTDIAPNTTNTSNKQPEVLDEATRKAEIQKTLSELMASGGLVVQKVEGRAAPYAINITQQQIALFEKLYKLDYINKAVVDAQDGKLKVSRIDKKINKLTDRAHELAVAGKFEAAADTTRKAVALAKEKESSSAEYAQLATDLANITEKYQYNVGLGSAGLAVAKYSKEHGYQGITYAVDTFHPAFMNICRQLCVATPNYGGIIDLGNGQRAVLESPELRMSANTLIDSNLKNFTPETYKNCPPEYKKGFLENLFLKTNMTPEQAKRNSSLLTAGGIGVGLFFLGKWLFTGKVGKKELKAGGFLGRLGIAAGSLLGINMLSQGFTGNSAMDMIKKLWYGDVKFEDLWNGNLGKDKILGARFDAANVCLRDVPMAALAGCSVEAPNGGIRVNIGMLESYVRNQLTDRTLSAERRAQLEQQLEAIVSLKNDPQGEQKLQDIFAEMGINYAYLSDSQNATKTLNENFDAKTKNGQKLQAYLDERGAELAVPDSDPLVSSFLLFGKPSLDDLAKQGKFRRKSAVEQTSGIEVVEPALKKIDKEYAAALQGALNKMVTIKFDNIGSAPKFEYENGVLSLASYGLNTPIWIDAQKNYRVTGLDIAFPSADEAVKTANLLNSIVATYNGSALSDEPFNFVLGDVKKTDAVDKLRSRWQSFDKTKVATAMRNLLGVEVVDGDDYTLFPWTKSTLKELGGNELGGDAGRTKLVNYLNGLKRSSDGESIWKQGANGKNGIVHTNEIKGWFNPNGQAFPEAKADDSNDDGIDTNTQTVTNNQNTGNSGAGGAGVATGAATAGTVAGSTTGENVDNGGVDTVGGTTSNWNPVENQPIKDGIENYTNIEQAKAKEWMDIYKGLDGGDKNGQNKEKRDISFFSSWVRAFNENQKYFTVDVMDGNTKIGLTYERQPGRAAPRRIIEGAPWGYKNTVEEKPAPAVSPAAPNAPAAAPAINVTPDKYPLYQEAINTHLKSDAVKNIITQSKVGIYQVMIGKTNGSKIDLEAIDFNGRKTLLGTLEQSDYALSGDKLNTSGIENKIKELFAIKEIIKNLTSTIKGKKYTYADIFPNGNWNEENIYITNFFNARDSKDPSIYIKDAYDKGGHRFGYQIDLGIKGKIDRSVYVSPKSTDFNEESFKKYLRKMIVDDFSKRTN